MACSSEAQQKEDMWVGKYAISMQEDEAKTIDTLIIYRIENANVKEESYFSKTGIFGIWLHKGLFNLKRINN